MFGRVSRGEGKKLTRHSETIAEESHTKSCHPEFISGSDKLEVGLQSSKMLKQVQHDIKRVAFTLAEVLITLAVIGVVAAITISTLTSNIEKISLETQYKKAYSMLSQMFSLVQTDYGLEVSDWYDWSIGNSSASYTVVAEKFIIPYLNVSKNCKTSSDGDCFASGMYKNLDGTDWRNINTSVATSKMYKFILADGMSVYTGYNSGCISSFQNCIYLLVDINGYSKPNQLGRDVFGFAIYPHINQLLPFGTRKIGDISFSGNSTEEIDANCLTDGTYCGAKIVKDGWKMNY